MLFEHILGVLHSRKTNLWSCKSTNRGFLKAIFHFWISRAAILKSMWRVMTAVPAPLSLPYIVLDIIPLTKYGYHGGIMLLFTVIVSTMLFSIGHMKQQNSCSARLLKQEKTGCTFLGIIWNFTQKTILIEQACSLLLTLLLNCNLITTYETN